MYTHGGGSTTGLGGYSGLGAMLPVIGTDQWVASILPEQFTQERWRQLQETITLGKNAGRVYDRASHEDYAWRLAVRDGWFPNTYEGYKNFLRWNSAGSQQRVAMGADGAAFDTFMRGWLAKALQVQPQIDAYLAAQKAKGVWIAADPLAPFIADPWLGLGGTIPQVTMPTTTAPATPTSTGYNGRVMQFQYDATVWNGAEGIYRIVAYRIDDIVNGRFSYGPWQSIGPWLVRLNSQEASKSNVSSGWYGPEKSAVMSELPSPSQWAQLVTSGEQSAAAFLKTLPFSVPTPQSWMKPLGSWISPAPAPAPIPYIPGSTVLVGPQGSGTPTLIKLPGSQEWTDVAAIDPALNQNRPASGGSQQVVSRGDLTPRVLDFGDGASAATGGGGASTGGNGVTAGGGNTGMLLLAAGAALLLFAGKKRGRR